MKEKLLQAIEDVFEYSHMGVALVDINGKFVHINKSFEDITGYSNEELKNKSFKEITHVDDLEKDYNLYLKLLSKEINSYKIEKRYIKKNKSIVWVELNVTNILDKNFNINYFLSIITNITNKINGAIKLRENFDEISKLNELLKENNEYLFEFAYFASHDMKEPLRAINGFSEILYENLENENFPLYKKKEYLGKIVKNVTRINNQIEDLLSFSEIDSKNQNYKKKQINVKDLINEYLNHCYEKDHVSLKIKNDINIFGYETLISKLFENLINNSIKYKKKNSICEIEIFKKINYDKQCIEIHYKDNGIGFDNKYSELIFKPFKRLHSYDNYPGSGIGLNICKKVMDKHEGKIEAHSEENKGALFIMSFPMKSQKGN